MNSEPRFPPKTILAATDLGPASLKALAYVRLLQALSGAETTVLHARHFDLPPYFTRSQTRTLLGELKKSRKAAAELVAGKARAVLGFAPKTLVAEGPPAEAILKAAESLDAGLLVIGTRGRTGLRRLWLGSTAESVLRRAERPVLAVGPKAGRPALGRILAPVGWGEAGTLAMDYAVALAQAAGAQLVLLHALESGRKAGACPWSREEVEKRCRLTEVKDASHPVESILKAVKEHKADLIVMGALTKPSAFRSLFSTTTEQVLRLTEAPVLVVPRKED